MFKAFFIFFMVLNFTWVSASDDSKGNRGSSGEKKSESRKDSDRSSYNDVGNGGLVSICPQDNGRLEYKFYDAKEWELRPYGDRVFAWGWSKSFFVEDTEIASLKDHKQIIEVLLKRLSTIDSVLAKRYREEVNIFLESANFFNPAFGVPAGFYDTKDLGFSFVKVAGCETQQMIVQHATFDLRDKYYVNSVLWNKLDEINKAVAIMHEALYSVAIEQGRPGNSQPIRLANKYLFYLMTKGDLQKNKIIRHYLRTWSVTMGYNVVGWGHFRLLTIGKPFLAHVAHEKYRLKFHDNLALKTAFVFDTEIEVPTVGRVAISGVTNFYDNGQVERVQLDPERSFGPFEVKINGKKRLCLRELSFYENSDIKSCI